MVSIILSTRLWTVHELRGGPFSERASRLGVVQGQYADRGGRAAMRTGPGQRRSWSSRARRRPASLSNATSRKPRNLAFFCLFQLEISQFQASFLKAPLGKPLAVCVSC